jgi:transposase
VLDQGGTVRTQQRVANESKALGKLLKSMKRKGVLHEGTQVCLEATGHYGYRAIMACMELGLRVWVAHPADIQLSLGMQRGKNDKADALRIAKYALKHPEKAVFIGANYMRFEEFKAMLSSREFFVRERAKCRGQLTDNVRFIPAGAARMIEQQLNQQILALEKSIATLDAAIEAFIRADEQLNAKRDLLLTVSGVGPVVANEILAVTWGFTRLLDPRKLTCYAGFAPFEHSSGKSIRGQTRISHRANKRIKSLMHLAAMAAIRVTGSIRDFYQRKLKEGKKAISVINAVRSKLIHHLCAVLRSGQPYKPYLQEP